MGLEFFEEGKLDEARVFFTNLITRFPSEIVHYTNFAAACFQQGDFQAAWPVLALAWRIAPQSLAVLTAMVDYFYNIGDYAKAENTSLLAASQGELDPLGIAVLALSQWKQGKVQEAIATAQPVLSLLSKYEIDNPAINELASLMQQRRL